METGATEDTCLAGQLVTSGPQEVMVTKVEVDSVLVRVEALTEATTAAMVAKVENCIVTKVGSWKNLWVKEEVKIKGPAEGFYSLSANWNGKGRVCKSCRSFLFGNHSTGLFFMHAFFNMN